METGSWSTRIEAGRTAEQEALVYLRQEVRVEMERSAEMRLGACFGDCDRINNTVNYLPSIRKREKQRMVSRILL